MSLLDFTDIKGQERREKINDFEQWWAKWREKIKTTNDRISDMGGTDVESWASFKLDNKDKIIDSFVRYHTPGGNWEEAEDIFDTNNQKYWRWQEGRSEEQSGKSKGGGKSNTKTFYTPGDSIPKEFVRLDNKGEIIRDKKGNIKFKQYTPKEVEIDEESLIKEGTLKPIKDTKLKKPSRDKFKVPKKLRSYADESKNFKPINTARQSLSRLKKDIKSNPFKKK